MQDVSDAMIEDLWLEEAKPVAILVTVTAPGLDEDILVTDYPGELTGTTLQGIVSRGNTYYFVPFTFAWTGASQDTPSSDAKLTIAGFDSQIEEALETALQAPTATIEIVRPADPDTVEMAIAGARIIEGEVNGADATCTVRPRDFSTEPYTKNAYVPSQWPGMF